MDGNSDEEKINEVLLKIQVLEEKNEKLRKKIEEKEKLVKQNKPSKNKIEKIEKVEKVEVITLENDRQAAVRFENELKFLNNNSLQILENLVEKKIEFNPTKQYGSMYILGDFNGWKPELMQKNETGFYFKVVLIKGFKFYYSFFSSDEMILDYNSPYEENITNSQLQNYLEIKQNENNKTTKFDSKDDLNILKAAQRNFLLLKLEDNIDNSIFLEKFKRHVINSKAKSNNKKNVKDDINLFFNNNLENINETYLNKFEKFLSYFNNRILIQNSPAIKEVQYQYKIKSISEDNNNFICVRLYDHNQIKLNNEYYKNDNNCWKVPFSKIVSTPITKRDKLYHLISFKESQKILEDYNNDTEDIIIAYFHDLNELNKNNRYRKYRSVNSVAEMVSPKKVEPNDVEMNDYNYYFLNNEIIHVVNKEDESYVEFKVVEENKKVTQVDTSIKINKIEEAQKPKIEIKNIENKNQQKEKIENKYKNEKIKKKENKPCQFLVYYIFSNSDNVIILHCHMLDKSFKYKKMIIKDILPDEDPHILKKDKIYINNNELLLITKPSGPIKLYFKGKKVQMKTKLISTDKLYRIKSINQFESAFHDLIVSINPIKEPFTLNNDIVEKCQENIYTGKEILNGIDAKVEYNDSFGEDAELAVSPCLLEELSNEEENLLKSKPKKEEKKEKKSYEMQKLDLIEKEMEKYRKYTKDMIKKMKNSEKDDIATTLDDYKTTMDMICNYCQDNELWDLIEKVSALTNEIEDLLNLFDNN